MCVPSSQECFSEDVDARTTDNKLLFRFGILDAKAYDLIDVSVRARCSVEGGRRGECRNPSKLTCSLDRHAVCRRQIKTQSQKLVKAWNRTQNDLVTTKVRESGLYALCFKKLGGSSGTISVFYSFDFISTGACVYRSRGRSRSRQYGLLYKASVSFVV